VPDWYRAMVPLIGGNPTPEWDIEGHLTFMIENGEYRLSDPLSITAAS